MNPSSNKAAAWQARELFQRHYRGASHATKKRRHAIAAAIADSIWRKWHVGIYRWRQKHLKWYLSVRLRDCSRHSQYQHYLVARKMIRILGHDSWLDRLDGNWSRPHPEKSANGAQ